MKTASLIFISCFLFTLVGCQQNKLDGLLLDPNVIEEAKDYFEELQGAELNSLKHSIKQVI